MAAFSASAAENPWKEHYAEQAAIATPTTAKEVHEVTYGDIKNAVAQELTMQGAGENLRVNIPRPDTQIIASNAESIEMQLADITFSEAFKTWNGVAHFSAAGKPLAPLKLSGSYDEMVEVALLKRRLANTDVIAENDITMQKLPMRRLRGEVITDAAQLIGKSPKRTISALRPIRKDEIINPPIVFKGDKIALMYHSGNMEIKTLGEALENGAEGDSIRVKNVDSHMVIQANIVSESVAEVGAGSLNMAPKNKGRNQS